MALRYQSSFLEWHNKASVRVKPCHISDLFADERPLYFAPELVPPSRHPLVREADLSEILLVHFLYSYLGFTVRLEHEIINTSLERIISGEFKGLLPEAMVADAYKILCDEAYHAQQSDELARQVEKETGIKPLELDCIPHFLALHRQQLSDYPEDYGQLGRLFMAIVSETLVSATLRSVAKNKSVHRAVREVINDHAIDESRHHAYFSAVLNYLWPTLTITEQMRIGAQLPLFIHAFLGPDQSTILQILCAIGFDRDLASTMISESYHGNETLDGIQVSANGTITALTRAGVFKLPEIKSHFQTAGLLANKHFKTKMKKEDSSAHSVRFVQ